MESSPLIKAHDHARAAATATHTSETTVAINEHTRAAGEFANAAKDTTSVEALRTLKLLEQHHRRLSELLQAPLQPPSSQASAETDSQEDEKGGAHPAPDPATATAQAQSLSNEKNAPPKPTLLKQPRYPARDLGASIASNLASARGIRSKYRSQPLSPSISNTEAPGSLEGASKKVAPRSRMQDMLDNSDKTSAIPASERIAGLAEDSSSREIPDSSTTSNDEGFSRFYSAFGSIINKISAPLAFAGLPLINEEQSEEQNPPPPPEAVTQKKNRVRHSASSAEPDIQKLYSRAALRAVAREGQSANDSFYVVPTSGHTASYASILSFADKEKRRFEGSAHATLGNLPEEADEDDFVDARESQMSHSPALKRRAGKGNTNNLVEELYLENKSLKDMIDLLSKRLHAFESISQNSGMRLAESMRLMRPGSPLSSVGKPGVSEEAFAREISELKQQNQALMKQNEELEKSYTKARANLVRYREKWDQLKAGAKARRAGSAQGNSEIVEEGLRSPSLA